MEQKIHKKIVYKKTITNRSGLLEDVKISNYLRTIVSNENCALTFKGNSLPDFNNQELFEKIDPIEYKEVSLEESTNILKEGLPLGFKLGNLYYFFKLLLTPDKKELLIFTNLRDTTLFLDELNLEKFLEIYFKDYSKNLLGFYDIKDNVNIWLN